MLLSRLIDGLEISNIEGSTEINISEVCYDSRKATKNSLFVCVSGFTTDAHKFAQAAVDNGATALLIEKDIEIKGKVTKIMVYNTRYALSYVADKYYDHPSKNFNLIGITGTKGKTTTTFMIKAIFEKYNQKVGLIGTITNLIGNKSIAADRTTPESLDLQELFSKMKDESIETTIMEVSSHALELKRVAHVDYDVGIFTNLSQDHMDFHLTYENYFNAKMKLFDLSKIGLVNIDNEYGKRAAEILSKKYFTYGIENKADIMAKNIEKNAQYVSFDFESEWGSGRIRVNIPGIFTVYNALAAMSAALIMGVPFEVVVEGITNVKVLGRAELVETNKDFTVMIDYAHSPDSLENILKTVKNYAKGRVVCVFGCGGDRDTLKRPIMGEISGKIVDFTIITSDNPRSEDPHTIVKEIEEGIKKITDSYIVLVDRKSAIKYAIENAQKDDVIIIAGKGHETYQIFKDKTIHFDEREIIAEILKELK